MVSYMTNEHHRYLLGLKAAMRRVDILTCLLYRNYGNLKLLET